MSFSSAFKLQAIPTEKLASNPFVISGAVTLSYLALYTAYDKQESKLIPSNLLDLVLVRRGWDWTLVELNKAISLSGLTTTILAFLPELKEQKRDLLFISIGLLWGHSAYSFYKFWQLNPKKLLSDKLIKRVSVVLGGLGQAALLTSYFAKQEIDGALLFLSTIGLSLAHFVTMEVDYKYRLQVRPYAYLPFPLAAYTIYQYFFGSSPAK